mmetsp:Transcript_5714/g.23606  ORF Transcript_5714/g.23606 Transcript_5714/m.23606 type:complete len:224 (-) Transcript_5714:2235-2906(-)
MLGGVHEKHQVHLVRGAEVVFFQVILHDLDHLGDIVSFLVHALLGLAVLVKEVAKDDVAILKQVLVCPGAQLVLDWVAVLVDFRLGRGLALRNRRILVLTLEHDGEVLLDELRGHHLVVVLVLDADESIVEHSHTLVNPEPRHDVKRLALIRGDEEHALEHLAQVAEVEGVVALLRRGQELLAHAPVNLDARVNHWRDNLLEFLGELLIVLWPEGRVKEPAED